MDNICSDEYTNISKPSSGSLIVVKTKPLKMMGVQQILLHPDEETKAILEYLCEQSGKLYNMGVYFARQIFFKTGKLLVGKFD